MAGELESDSPNAKVVTVSYCSYTDFEWHTIFEAFAKNTNCEEFNAQCCALRDTHIEHLVQGLKRHPKLQVLRLNMNFHLGDSSARHLAQSLRENTVLRVLCLPHCKRIGDTGAEYFARVLPVNDTLQEIVLDGTRITDKGAELLKNKAARNCALTKIKLNHFSWTFSRICGMVPCRVGADVQAEVDKAVSSKPTNLSSSHFNKKYVQAGPLLTDEELYALIRKIIVGYFAHDLGTNREAIPATAQPFADKLIGELRQSSHKLIPCLAVRAWTSRLTDGTSAEPFTYGRLTACLAVKAWTSAKDCSGLTFFSIIQDCLREDVEGPLMQSIAQYCRTLNQFVVIRRSDHPTSFAIPSKAWPALTERGAWIPREHIDFFKRIMVSEGGFYRYAGYLATSSRPGTAKQLLEDSPPTGIHDVLGDVDGKLPVKFVFHFNQSAGCKHVNYLGYISLFQGECEWLFQHYSCFKVRSVADIEAPSPGCPFTVDNPVEIHLEVQVDGMDHNLNLKLAMWH